MSRFSLFVVCCASAMISDNLSQAAEPALANNPTVIKLVAPPKSVAQADAILAQQMPNVNPLFGQQGGRGIATRPVDNSQQLMDVITSCIAPTTWDVNGGQGAARYYAPSQALVVRQTSEIHEQLLRILPKLRQ